MSAGGSEAAIRRLAAIHEAMGHEGFGSYAFLVLGILGWDQPDVLAFLLDEADERLRAVTNE